ncbi:MAG: hypothetical protein K2X71_11730 [Methylobacterium sp.]|uniref:helix-turn-helix transcriptional regulator n=1 Tax=Methylobacterium sp. TaxID=409 RepID=UPI00258CE268|nr:hypothetical protein [Methylobacterium sp.]MBY0296696.1 hypothetical protein [Methylobacterium sp.]
MSRLAPGTVSAAAALLVRRQAAPRRFLRLRDAALYVGVSESKFLQLVASTRLPQPFRVDGCVLWDLWELDPALDDLKDQARGGGSSVAMNKDKGWEGFDDAP